MGNVKTMETETAEDIDDNADDNNMVNNVLENIVNIDGAKVISEVNLRQNVFHRLHDIKKRTFLECFSLNPSLTAAAKVAGIDRTMHNYWLETDLEYVEAFNEASEISVELLETEVRRRALHGVEEPVYQKGELVGHIQKYSDTLAIFLLKAHNPNKYRDNMQVNISGDLTIKTASMSDTDKLDLIKSVAAKAMIDAAVDTTYSVLEDSDDSEINGEPANS